MKNLRIALKFAFSFGGLLLLLAVVALWSVFGIRGIVGDAEEVIDGNKLRGDMVQKEVDHLNWANKVNALLVDKHITELDVQTDPHKCAFGKWLYGEGRQQAETAIPALKGLLTKIEKPHSGLHDSAIQIGKVFKQADPELPAILEARMIDHLNWADRFRNTFLANKEKLHVQLDPTKCGLGKWLHSKEAKEIYKNAGPEFRELWDEMVPIHAKLHESAVPVVNGYAQINPGLKELLLRRLVDHKTWAEKVSYAIIVANADLGVQTDHTKCAYGKFLDSQELADMMSTFPALRTAIEQSKEPHKKLHESAIAIASALQKGNKTEAVRIFNSKTEKALEEVEANLQQAIQAEDSLDRAQHAAFMLFEDKTAPLLHETLEVLEEMEKEAELELRGMHEANSIFATQTKPNLHAVQELLDEARDTVDEYMMTDEVMIAAASKTNMAVIIISIIALTVGLVLAFFMSRSITVPLAATVGMIKEMSKGHLTERLKLNRGDEIGQMADAMDNFSDDLEKETVGALVKLADGDLTFDATPKDAEDAIGNALQKTGEDLNNIIMEIQMASEQIATGSGQVSDASQSLSQGASESAASLEQITSSMTEMAAQTKTNAENSGQANQLAGQARDAAEKGNDNMNDLVKAISEINESGQNISKIIKVIDEIAFQTNLLALNAAVEAARAGKHGKGFAVVAEEVRNLAARSAKAAQETAELIEGSVEKAKNGSEIAGRTSETLAEIVTGATKVTDLVGEIAAASNEQAQGISQVNQGLTQIEQVTQQNTASAEECAAAAEELSSQALHMQNMMAKFTVKGGSSTQRALPGSQRALPHPVQQEEVNQYPQPSESSSPNDVISLDDEEFGKY